MGGLVDLAGRWVVCGGSMVYGGMRMFYGSIGIFAVRGTRPPNKTYAYPHKPLRPGGLTTTKPTICQFCTWLLEMGSQATFPTPQPPANGLNSRLNRHANAPREGASRGAREGDQPAPCSQLSPTSWCACSYGAEAKSTRRRARV